jgi:predicted DCC family thiol-disulfide oxidoreductase YuxK
VRPTVLYDADCNLCQTIVAVLGVWDRRGALRFAAIQGPAGDEHLGDMTPEDRLASFHFVDGQGRRFSGGPALAPMLAALPGGRPPATALERAPGVADRVYRAVTDNREAISRFVPAAIKDWAERRLASGRDR